jgi:hypothetical protein
MAETTVDSRYAILAEPAGEAVRGETALTGSEETLDGDREERDHWLLTLGH